MSAWIVSKHHINAMVFTILRSESPLNDMDPNELGRMLWRENVNSVAYRYSPETIDTLPGPDGLSEEIIDGYTYREPVRKPNPGEVGQIFACYGYQSCEHPEWEESLAKRIVDAMEAATKDIKQDPDAPWGWDFV